MVPELPIQADWLERFNIEKQHAVLKWRLRLPFRSPVAQAHFTNSAD